MTMIHFKEFTHLMAYEMGSEAIQIVKERQLRRIGVRITLHDVCVFQFLMDGKNEDNYLKGKENVVFKTEKASIEVYEQAENYSDLLNDANYCVSGGAIPIFVENQIYGCISISGMTQEADHALALEVLSNAYNKV